MPYFMRKNVINEYAAQLISVSLSQFLYWYIPLWMVILHLFVNKKYILSKFVDVNSSPPQIKNSLHKTLSEKRKLEINEHKPKRETGTPLVKA